MNDLTQTNSKRFLLIDLIRSMSVIAILTFHVSEFIFFQDVFPYYKETTFWPIFEGYSQIIPFSGHTVIALAFFMWGYKNKTFTKAPLVAAFILLGHILISLNFYVDYEGLKQIDWDIYPFIAIALLFLRPLQLLGARPKLILTSFCFALLFLIRPDSIQYAGPLNPFKGMIFSTCFQGGSGAWPLFPWLAFPLGFYLLGLLIAEREGLKTYLQTISKRESLLWTILIMSGLTLLALSPERRYFGISVGPHYYCMIMNHAPLDFWSHFLPIVFAMRLSFVNSLNTKLYQSNILKWNSALAWNRAFGRTYLVQIALLTTVGYWDAELKNNPTAFDIIFLCLFPLSEILSRLLEKLFLKLKKSI